MTTDAPVVSIGNVEWNKGHFLTKVKGCDQKGSTVELALPPGFLSGCSFGNSGTPASQNEQLQLIDIGHPDVNLTVILLGIRETNSKNTIPPSPAPRSGGCRNRLLL